MSAPTSSSPTAAPTRSAQVTVAGGEGAHRPRLCDVVTEEPLEIRVDGHPLAVVMRTPGDDLELAAGFLRAEGIVRNADDIALIAHCRDGDDPDLSNVVNVRLTEERRTDAGQRLAALHAERSTVTSASCGVCGKRTIESLQVDAPPFDRPIPVDPRVVTVLPERLRAAQTVFEATGGLHAAGLFDATGQGLIVREDVGRHNAVDKVIGALILREADIAPDAILMVSGRTSFEIVQKALVARIRTIAAVSAPTSLAVELSRSSRMTLMGFVRGSTFNVYSGVVLD